MYTDGNIDSPYVTGLHTVTVDNSFRPTLTYFNSDWNAGFLFKRLNTYTVEMIRVPGGYAKKKVKVYYFNPISVLEPGNLALSFSIRKSIPMNLITVNKRSWYLYRNLLRANHQICF